MFIVANKGSIDITIKNSLKMYDYGAADFVWVYLGGKLSILKNRYDIPKELIDKIRKLTILI